MRIFGRGARGRSVRGSILAERFVAFSILSASGVRQRLNYQEIPCPKLIKLVSYEAKGKSRQTRILREETGDNTTELRRLRTLHVPAHVFDAVGTHTWTLGLWLTRRTICLSTLKRRLFKTRWEKPEVPRVGIARYCPRKLQWIRSPLSN
jgi:hypothetical protein